MFICTTHLEMSHGVRTGALMTREQVPRSESALLLGSFPAANFVTWSGLYCASAALGGELLPPLEENPQTFPSILVSHMLLSSSPNPFGLWILQDLFWVVNSTYEVLSLVPSLGNFWSVTDSSRLCTALRLSQDSLCSKLRYPASVEFGEYSGRRLVQS